MSLMVSISGIRGVVGEDLTPLAVIRYVSAFAHTLKKQAGKVLVGRDTRGSGVFITKIVEGTLAALGRDVVSIGVATTPTVLLLTRIKGCDGGIAVTASHNPIQWNALKFCDHQGLFLLEDDIRTIEKLSRSQKNWDDGWKRSGCIGAVSSAPDASRLHAEEVMKALDTPAIRRRKFKVLVDPGGGAGSAIDRLFLEELGCKVTALNEAPIFDTHAVASEEAFPRGTEPTPENLIDLCRRVPLEGADVGFAQDPDGDRLGVVSETGVAVGEEYTLILAGEAFLRKRRSDIACNLSTSMMVDDLAGRHGVSVVRTPIGEINVTAKLLEKGLLLGGEGNGGVIVPGINPCRDSIVGMGLILDLLADSGKSVSELVRSFPSYTIKKGKCDLPDMDKGVLYKTLLEWARAKFTNHQIDDTDGVKVYGKKEWVHLRLSNTEPVMRVIAEAEAASRVDELISAGVSFVDFLKSQGVRT